MTTRAVLAVAAVGIVLGSGALASEVYDQEARVAYLVRALAAVRASPSAELEALQDALDRAQRLSCLSSSHDLNVRCLARAGVRGCRDAAEPDRCLVVADVAVTHKLSEDGFVGVAQRYELMRTEKRYREAFRAVLHQERAHLATELLLAGPSCGDDDHCLARAIDAHCARQSARSWQHCAAALTWFIAGAGR